MSIEEDGLTRSDLEFYNTLFSSCTTNVFDEINTVIPKEKRIGLDWRILVPENSVEIFYNKKMLDVDYSQFPTYEQLKESSNIQTTARENRNLESREFSERVHRD
jgi:hypothetical protein